VTFEALLRRGRSQPLGRSGGRRSKVDGTSCAKLEVKLVFLELEKSLSRLGSSEQEE
jgi:hypothetical protein